MDDKNRHLSEKEILEISANAKHKTFGDLGLDEINSKNKGGLGGFVEENVFKYKANSDDNPDFIDAGIELKVTPVKQNTNGSYSSKERLVLNMINYKDEALKSFKTSSFYKKNKRLLIWFYLYSLGLKPSEYEILDYDLFEFEHSIQYKVIERDWNIIHEKIAAGKAHEISESDTEFLAACTKGANSSVLVEQYNSQILAKPRAYSFKSSFMTHLVRERLHKIAPYNPSISEEEWMKNPLEEIYKEKMSFFKGMTQIQLARRFGIPLKQKSLNFRIAQKMLGLSGNQNSTYEMEMAGITLRTITVDAGGRPTECMPFGNFEFEELINIPWEESYIREDFADLKLMLFVFRKTDSNITFERVHFYNFPNKLVDTEIKKMHEDCANMVRNGKAFYFDNHGKIKDKFPKEKRNSNGVCHVRPHAQTKADKYILPIPDKETGITEFTKQSFWFNKDLVQKILENKI